jgi:hypothetical protein
MTNIHCHAPFARGRKGSSFVAGPVIRYQTYELAIDSYEMWFWDISLASCSVVKVVLPSYHPREKVGRK